MTASSQPGLFSIVSTRNYKNNIDNSENIVEYQRVDLITGNELGNSLLFSDMRYLVKGNNMDINFLLFDDFETLDAFGPVEILARLDNCPVHFFSIDGGSITSRQGTIIKTKSVNQIDRDGILVVPGGLGTRLLVEDTEFLEQLHQIADQAMYCLSVCTGSALLAKSGVLEGRRATSNKRAFQWVKSVNEKVDWVSKARWVVDGKFYSSSGVSAGMDMALGFISDLFGRKKAEEIADIIEYEWNSEMEKDLFTKGN